MSKQQKKYLLIGIILFLVEVLIAVFVKDRIIRPYGGDVLAVVMLYAFFRAFVSWKPVIVAIVVLGIALAIELAQLADLLGILGLKDVTILRIVLGSQFEWLDLVAYALGGLLAFMGDRSMISGTSSG